MAGPPPECIFLSSTQSSEALPEDILSLFINKQDVSLSTHFQCLEGTFAFQEKEGLRVLIFHPVVLQLTSETSVSVSLPVAVDYHCKLLSRHYPTQ